MEYTIIGFNVTGPNSDVTIPVRERYPYHMPITITNMTRGTQDNFLCKRDCSFMALLATLRKKVKCDDNTALFLLVGDKSINSNSNLEYVYNTYKCPKNGILYLTYELESCFG